MLCNILLMIYRCLRANRTYRDGVLKLVTNDSGVEAGGGLFLIKQSHFFFFRFRSHAIYDLFLSRNFHVAFTDNPRDCQVTFA